VYEGNMAAVGLFSGAGLIITYLNDEARTLFAKGQDFVGVPHLEAFTGPFLGKMIGDVLSRVNETRRAECVPCPNGVFWALPIEGGVAMHYAVAPRPRPQEPPVEADLLEPAR
jgi:hypothetical protein